MVTLCPHCGAVATRPMVGTRGPQQVFNFIWNNPGCTKETIQQGVYGRHLRGSNVVAAHMWRIRRGLLGTNFRLERYNERHYRIIMLEPTPLVTKPFKEPANVPTNV